MLLPFFAVDPQQHQSGAPGAAASAAATVMLRLPLGTIFDGRDYVFVTELNVHTYEWTTRKAGLLMDDLVDAALLGGGGGGAGRIPTGLGGGGGDGRGARPVVSDYELSQIVIVLMSDWDSDALGLGNRYDVYDNQQRLVTLLLLLAGLRDSFRRKACKLLPSSPSRLAAASGGGR